MTPRRDAMQSKKNRVFVIGIDGGTFHIIDRLVDDGRLPHFQKMLRSGCRSVLKTTLPPITAPAWASFATGKNPGKHGLFNFMTFKKGTYEIELVNATNIKSRQIWHYFHDNNRPFVSLNVPVTYPPLDLNGIIVSGLLTPPKKIFSNRREIVEELRKHHYLTDIPDEKGITRRDYFETVKKMSEKRFEIAHRWIAEKPWDFFMVVFVGSDRIQHKLWDKQEWLEEYYVMLDGYVGELADRAGPETYVMLMSDHGFTSQKRTFFVNEWLASIGLLKMMERSDKEVLGSWGTAKEGRERKKRSRLYKLLRKIGFSHDTRRKFIADWLWNILLRFLPKSLRGIVPQSGIQLDWRKTEAYANTCRPIYVNLKGREANGIVGPGEEYESVVRQIKEHLVNLIDPNTGKKPFKNVFTREELFHGPYASSAPDILFHSDDFSYDLRGGKSSTGALFKSIPDRISNHDQDGIFLLAGPDVKTGIDLGHTSIFDIAPTILHIMGIPVPDDMDGKVLTQSFDDTSALAGEVEFQKATGYSIRTQKKTTDEEERELQRRLRDLGYLS